MRRTILAALLMTCVMSAMLAVGASADFDAGAWINVISREDGSGTRGAFIELFGVQVKGEDGGKKDMTSEEAQIANQTEVMLSAVAGDPSAIGYVSLGSMNDAVKALDIDGAKATTGGVKDGSNKIVRPFNIATQGEPGGVTKDFIGFILSAEGQKVVGDNGYISVSDHAAAYAGSMPAGKVVVAGSSSVAPIMEKLREAYLNVNPNVQVEVQMSDSTTGMTAAMDGSCDIGMASRELTEKESRQLSATVIAQDGIAVIVNPQNPIAGATKEQIRKVFVGEITTWVDVQ